MRNILKYQILLVLLFNFSFAYCDTTDHYQVFYNHNLIKKNSAGVKDSTPVILEKSAIKENDSLIIKYWKDALCDECKFFIVVIDDKKRYVKVLSCVGRGMPLAISIEDIRQWSEYYKVNSFEVYYYEEKPAFPIDLFTLILQ